MTDHKRTCPECHLTFEAPQPETDLLTCPLCESEFPTAAPAAGNAPAGGKPTAPLPAGYSYKEFSPGVWGVAPTGMPIQGPPPPPPARA